MLHAFFLGDSPASEFLYADVSKHCSIFLPAYEDGTGSISKRQHIKFKRRRITQKKAYNNNFLFPPPKIVSLMR